MSGELDQDVFLDRRPESRVEPWPGDIGDGLEEVVGDGAADHRAGAQHLTGGRGERVQPRQQQVAHGRRELAGPVEGEQLLGEERVALGPGIDLVEERAGGGYAEDVAELPGLLLAGQRLEYDVVVPATGQLGRQPEDAGVLRGPRRCAG